MGTYILPACVASSGVLFAWRGDWPSAVVFCAFGGVFATQQWLEKQGELSQRMREATDKLSAKSEQVQALESKVHQLNERMLRYETRAR